MAVAISFLDCFQFFSAVFPLYLKDSGIVPAENVSFWSGFFIAAASISLMIMSPIWGALGDRYGRKMMLVRANLGGAFALYLMGVVNNIEALVILRFLQGAFTGTIPATQTLVATHTPDRKQGFAIGLIMAAVNAGNLTGAFLGDMSAQYYGPATSFKISGVMLLISTFLVLFAVRENFSRPARAPALTQSARIRRRRKQLTSVAQSTPILVAIALVAFIQTFDGPYLSLYVEYIYTHVLSLAGPKAVSAAYGTTGIVSAVASVAAVAGSIITGIIMDKKVPGWCWALVAVASGIGAAIMAVDVSFFGLGAGRFLFAFCLSGLASVLVVILGRITPPSQTGGVFGWSVTVRALGWIFAPLAGAQAAKSFGWTPAFSIEAVLSLALAPLFFYLFKRFQTAYPPDKEDEVPPMQDVGQAQVSSPHLNGRMG